MTVDKIQDGRLMGFCTLLNAIFLVCDVCTTHTNESQTTCSICQWAELWPDVACFRGTRSRMWVQLWSYARWRRVRSSNIAADSATQSRSDSSPSSTPDWPQRRELNIPVSRLMYSFNNQREEIIEADWQTDRQTDRQTDESYTTSPPLPTPSSS